MIRNTLISLCMLFLVSSCTTTKYKVIHKPNVLLENCIFEKFTEEEKDSMIEAVGRKIYRNQENCRIRHERNQEINKAHNEAHKVE